MQTKRVGQADPVGSSTQNDQQVVQKKNGRLGAVDVQPVPRDVALLTLTVFIVATTLFYCVASAYVNLRYGFKPNARPYPGDF